MLVVEGGRTVDLVKPRGAHSVPSSQVSSDWKIANLPQTIRLVVASRGRIVKQLAKNTST